LNEGGTLSILLDLAAHLDAQFAREDIVYLINDRVAPHFAGRRFEIYAWPKRSWLKRVWFEKAFIRRVERRLQPKLWISLHDITAALRRTPQLLYCHNPSPFLDRAARLPVLDLKFTLFVRFYAYLYRWDIARNRYVVVQQEWLRREFLRRFPLRADQVVVARPIERRAAPALHAGCAALRPASPSAPLRLIYPALPRVFKNIEYLGELARILAADPIEFMITISGDENRYARFLKRRYGTCANLHFIGRQSRESLFGLYEGADALIFPSRLETWGLPLSEFMQTRKPIFAADLPYAHEVLSGYPCADFFPLDRAEVAAGKLRNLAAGKFSARDAAYAPAHPLCPDWESFVQFVGAQVA
jgi:glycosyltransferase involved in cell wall biosynthesis